MIREVTRFTTSDGDEHLTLADAETHEAALVLGAAIDDSGCGVYGRDAQDLARWLLANYNITPKERT